MFRLSALTRRLTAMTFLVIFLNVTVGQCLCAVAGPTPIAAKLTLTKLMHSDCPGHAPKAKSVAHDHHEQPTKSSGHGCCKDHSDSVLAGLTTPPVEKLAAPVPFVLSLPPVLDFSFACFTAWNRAAKVLLVSPQHLKPKIPDIRIFIQSLTV